LLTTHQVASGLAKWAISRGLIEHLPPDVDDVYLAPSPLIPLSAEAEQILRHKEIQTISYNSTSKTIFFYTRKKVTQKDLQTLPTSVQRNGIAYPQGHLDTVGKSLGAAQGATYAIHKLASGKEFYSCGSSISPGNDASAGTMGALVKMPDGLLYGLTNNHVSALCSHVQPETPILAPGVVDVGPGGIPPFTLGYHSKALEMKVGSLGNVDIAGNLDGAVFRLHNTGVVSSMQGNAFDTPMLVADPVEGMKVEKVGRTTRHTKGHIVSRELRPVGINYQAQNYGFTGVIRFANVFTIHGLQSEFSASGDSGSLVVQVDDQGRPLAAVGLIFAGGPDSMAPGGAKSLMLPLRPILDALGATLVGGFNV
jgi:hypothetical protein